MEQLSLFGESGDTSEQQMPSTIPQWVQVGDIWQMGGHKLLCGNATDRQHVARLFGDEHYDFCYVDPPYGIGFDEWDKPLENVPGLIALITEYLKPGGFFALAHQLPHALDWLVALRNSSLRFKDHIAWVKRVATTNSTPLHRSHESLFVYSSAPHSDYYMVKGAYTDVKLPGLLFDLITIESIKRYISDLHLKLRRGHGKQASPITRGNDETYWYMDKAGSSLSSEQVNFTNVWSFLPEGHNQKSGKIKLHPTRKPVLLLQRLLNLCTHDDSLIYDPFLGSGTTIIAAQVVGKRRVYGCEISPEYCDLILARWEQHTGQKATLAERISLEDAS